MMNIIAPLLNQLPAIINKALIRKNSIIARRQVSKRDHKQIPLSR